MKSSIWVKLMEAKRNNNSFSFLFIELIADVKIKRLWNNPEK
jgi:predicted CopG family antitoxin